MPSSGAIQRSYRLPAVHKNKNTQIWPKVFLFYDCETGIVLKSMLYTGKETQIMPTAGLGFSGAVVHTLLEPYLHKGHILHTDNHYTSPHLSTFLHDQ